MSATTAESFEMYPRFNARHLIGALALLGLLILLPLLGLGPTNWRHCLGVADTAVATTPAPNSLPTPPPTEPPAPPAQTTPAAPAPAVPAASAPAIAAPASAPASEPPAISAAPATPAPAASAKTPRAVIYFGFNGDALPADARRRLAPIVAFLKAQAGAKVQISGYHDSRGNRIYNEDLAERRAIAVRAALERAGIKRSRIIIARPAKTTGNGKPEEARRTEVTIIR